MPRATELEPGTEGDVIQGAIRRALDLQYETEDFIKTLERVRDQERRDAHQKFLTEQASAPTGGSDRG